MSIFPGPQPGGGSALTFASIAATATGTPSASTYLRGDGTWATVSGGITRDYCQYNGIAARGSTNTYNVRWSTAIVAATTVAITYVASSTLGDSFTCNISGDYAIIVNLYASTAYQAQLMIGATITNSVNTADAENKGTILIPANGFQNLVYIGPITAGQKIWVACGAAPNNAEPNINSIKITRLT